MDRLAFQDYTGRAKSGCKAVRTISMSVSWTKTGGQWPDFRYWIARLRTIKISKEERVLNDSWHVDNSDTVYCFESCESTLILTHMEEQRF